MSSDTQYIRGKAQERGAYSEKFMTDGFDRWAQTDAPARVGQSEKIPSDTVNTTMSGLGMYEDMGHFIQPKGRRTTRPKAQHKGMPGYAPHRRQTMTTPMPQSMRARGFPTGYEGSMHGMTCPHCMGEMSADGFFSSALSLGKTAVKGAVSLGKKAITYSKPYVKKAVGDTVKYLNSPDGKKLVKEVGEIAIPYVAHKLGLPRKQEAEVIVDVEAEEPDLDEGGEPIGSGMRRRRQGHQSRMNERLGMEIANLQRRGMRTQRARRAPSERNMIVRQVMMERGVSLPQASRIVKEEGLY